jgi:hypothetical protein
MADFRESSREFVKIQRNDRHNLYNTHGCKFAEERSRCVSGRGGGIPRIGVVKASGKGRYEAPRADVRRAR